MANKKFSEFVLKTSTSDVSHIVGYNGAENVQITPANFLDTTGGPYLPLAGGLMVGNTTHNDNVKSIYGTANDGLEIYHDGSNSYIADSGTGDLVISSSDDLRFRTASGENYITCNENAGIELYYDNAKKFETTSTGISVTGEGVFSGIGTFNSDGGGTALKLIARASGETSVVRFYANDGVTQNAWIGSSNADFNFNSILNLPLTFNTNNTLALTLDATQNASFAGSITSGAGDNFDPIIRAGRTASAPAYSFTGDLDTGMFNPNTSNTVAFATGGSERMRLDASGNLGLGTSSVSASDGRLKISAPSGNTAIAGLSLYGNNSSTYGGSNVVRSKIESSTDGSAFGSNMLFSTNDVNNVYQERMRIDSAGKVSVGTPVVGQLGVRGTTDDSSAYSFESANSSGASLFAVRNDGLAVFPTSGNVGIGTATPTDYFSAADNLVVKQASGGGGISVVTDTSSEGALYFADGTTGDETYRGGMSYNHATNNLFLISGGASRVTINGAGNMGIGTSNSLAQTKLNVNGNSTIEHPDGASQSSNGLRVRRTNSSSLDQVGAEILAAPYSVNTNAGDLIFKTSNNSANLVERVRINGAGDLLVGTTTGTGLATGASVNQGISLSTGVITSQINTNANQYWSKATGYTSGDFTAHFVNNVYVGGISTNGSSTTYATASDYRLKEDLQDFKGLDLVSKIPVYDYKWKADEFRSYGVMAHELQEVLPQAVTGDKDAEEMQGVDYSKIVPLLVKSIQELSAKLEALECQCEKK